VHPEVSLSLVERSSIRTDSTQPPCGENKPRLLITTQMHYSLCLFKHQAPHPDARAGKTRCLSIIFPDESASWVSRTKRTLDTKEVKFLPTVRMARLLSQLCTQHLWKSMRTPPIQMIYYYQWTVYSPIYMVLRCKLEKSAAPTHLKACEVFLSF